MAEIAKAYVQIVPTTKDIAKNIRDSLNGADGAFEEAGNSAGTSFADKLKSAFVKAGVAAFITKSVKDAFENGADFEQLWGGAKNIFAGMDTSKILADAKNAYKDLGMSVNEYLSKINDVGAAFKSTMGDEAGYATARKGLQAISDYATGTGKSLTTLSEKFTMITRSTSSYQSIADQFSGILPATSQEFLKQAQAAGDLNDSYTSLTQVPIAEYQQAVANALERGVDALNLTGNTAEEASSTLSGAIQKMSASWQNFLTSLTSKDLDVGDAFRGLLDSLQDVIRVATPMILDFAASIGEAIVEALPEIIPRVIDIFKDMFTQVANSLPDIWGRLSDTGKLFMVISSVIIAIKGVAAAIELCTKAQEIFNLVTDMNPYVALAVVVAALAAGVAYYASQSEFAANINKKLDRTILDMVIRFESLKAEIQEAGGVFEYLKEKMSTAFDGLDAKIKPAIESMKNSFKEFYDYLPAGMQKADADFIRATKAMFNKFKNELGNATNAVKTWSQEFVDGAVEAIRKMADTIITTIQELPDRIKQAGIEMAQGLLQGFEEKIDSVRNKIVDSVEEIIEAIKEVLNIHSPSRVFADEIGAQMAAGIGVGFTKEMPRVTSDIKNSIEDSLDAGSSTLRSALGSAQGTELGGSSLAREIAVELGRINLTTNVILEGDAGTFFRAMQEQDSIFKKSTGRSAFA